MTVLETDRLILRRFNTDDAGFILGLLNEPSFLRYIGDKGVATLADARNYLREGPIDSYQRFGFGLYMAELKNGGIPIGMCGLLKRETLDDVDIGFAFLPDYWKTGYGYESASAVLTYARDELNLTRIVAVTSRQNYVSIRLLEKLGFEFERRVTITSGGPEIKLFAIGL